MQILKAVFIDLLILMTSVANYIFGIRWCSIQYFIYIMMIYPLLYACCMISIGKSFSKSTIIRTELVIIYLLMLKIINDVIIKISISYLINYYC